MSTNPNHPTLAVACPQCGAAPRTACRSLNVQPVDPSPLALPVLLNSPHRPRSRLAQALASACPSECACAKCLPAWQRQTGPHRTRYERALRVTFGERGLVLPGYVQLIRSHHADDHAKAWHALAHVDLTRAVEPQGGDLDVDTQDTPTATEALGAAMGALRSLLALMGAGATELWPAGLK